MFRALICLFIQEKIFSLHSSTAADVLAACRSLVMSSIQFGVVWKCVAPNFVIGTNVKHQTRNYRQTSLKNDPQTILWKFQRGFVRISKGNVRINCLSLRNSSRIS
jgi:hypothetical protein